ncbi:hypothetical protein F7725_013958 [Dissostichus mawsoni]|uniref:Uncharacterized protein n=1 Tax=Dissostichus mawsoni TaxID=36200 RepID=A0A7J5YUZ8_DISMA|nr:hypothetical protein F7725_013958 [Dissostichus mawsoni]
MELSAIGEQVFAVEGILKKRVKKDTVYTMDLRSAHKPPDDPPLPRLRLSLTRSLLPEEEERSLASCRRRETPEQHPGSKTWRSKFTCLHSDPRSPTAEDWEGRGEGEERRRRRRRRRIPEEEEEEEEEEKILEAVWRPLVAPGEVTIQQISKQERGDKQQKNNPSAYTAFKTELIWRKRGILRRRHVLMMLRDEMREEPVCGGCDAATVAVAGVAVAMTTAACGGTGWIEAVAIEASATVAEIEPLRPNRPEPEVGPRRLNHLLLLLWAHWAAVLPRRPPAEMLLLLEEPLVDVLLHLVLEPLLDRRSNLNMLLLLKLSHGGHIPPCRCPPLSHVNPRLVHANLLLLPVHSHTGQDSREPRPSPRSPLLWWTPLWRPPPPGPPPGPPWYLAAL